MIVGPRDHVRSVRLVPGTGGDTGSRRVALVPGTGGDTT
jgi:hypothetical protein